MSGLSNIRELIHLFPFKYCVFMVQESLELSFIGIQRKKLHFSMFYFQWGKPEIYCADIKGEKQSIPLDQQDSSWIQSTLSFFHC